MTDDLIQEFDESAEDTLRLKWEEQRQFIRVPCCIQVMLHLKNGHALKGTTGNISFSGAYLKVSGSLKNSDIEIGDEGRLFCILTTDGQELKIEFMCQIARIADDSLGLRFVKDEFSENNPVYARRSSGDLGEGWSIIPPNELVPESVRTLVKLKEQSGPCVICIRVDVMASQIGYKVLTLQELVANQC